MWLNNGPTSADISRLENAKRSKRAHMMTYIGISALFILSMFWLISSVIVIVTMISAVKYGILWILLQFLVTGANIVNVIFVFAVDFAIVFCFLLCQDDVGYDDGTTTSGRLVLLATARTLCFGLIFTALLGYLLLCPGSGMLPVDYYNSLFYYWSVINFKLTVAFYFSYFMLVFDHFVGDAICRRTDKISGKTSDEISDETADSGARKHLLLSIPLHALSYFGVYYIYFKFDWKYWVDIYVASKSSDLQQASNATLSDSAYYSTIFVTVLLVLMYIYRVYKQYKRIEVPVADTSYYYQAAPVSL